MYPLLFMLELAIIGMKRIKILMLNKKLIFINGTMGVGKSTICKALHQKIDHSVWLDGDWCWMMHPWEFSAENKNMVIDNITHMLNNFLKNSSFKVVIFSWIMHQEEICATILNNLHTKNYELTKITLIADEKTLSSRMQKDKRDKNTIQASISRLKLYTAMQTIKIDTSNFTVDDVVEKILTKTQLN